MSKDTYRTIFREKLCLKFNKPKKDVCDHCQIFLNTTTDQQTDEMKLEHADHLNEKELTRAHMKECQHLAKADKEVHSAAFDFQKTLQTPEGNASSFYYYQRLRNYNFTVTSLGDLSRDCYLWNEANGAKGSCEVASSIFMYLQTLKKTGVSKVHLFCDRCVGQNANRIVFVMLSYAMNILGFSEIYLNFLVTGHSQNLNDNTHALIEKNSKNAQIFTTSQWETLIYQAFKSNSVKVVIQGWGNMINFKKVANDWPQYSHLYQGSSFGDENDKILWTKIMQLKFTAENPQKLFYKYKYSEDYKMATFVKEKRSSSRIGARPSGKCSWPAVSELLPLYKSALSISKDKKTDLLKLCRKNLIPPHHHNFYKELPLPNEE